MPRLLVRRPSPRLAEGELTHIERVPVDAALAQSQWESYVDVFRQRGWEIVEVDAGGLSSSELAAFPYRRIRRPIAPLDAGVWSLD